MLWSEWSTTRSTTGGTVTMISVCCAPRRPFNSTIWWKRFRSAKMRLKRAFNRWSVAGDDSMYVECTFSCHILWNLQTPPNIIHFKWFQQSDEITYQKPEYLQFLDVKVITNRECILRQTETYRKFIYGGTICTHMKRGHGSCYEDEGNPLVYNGKQIGVSSWEISCARGKPEGFTRISEFLDWIQSESGVVAV